MDNETSKPPMRSMVPAWEGKDCVACEEPATEILWAKPLCDYHYMISRH